MKWIAEWFSIASLMRRKCNFSRQISGYAKSYFEMLFTRHWLVHPCPCNGFKSNSKISMQTERQCVTGPFVSGGLGPRVTGGLPSQRITNACVTAYLKQTAVDERCMVCINKYENHFYSWTNQCCHRNHSIISFVWWLRQIVVQRNGHQFAFDICSPSTTSISMLSL